MAEAKMAFIGGSGVYDLDGLGDVESVDVETPFGSPSDSIVVGSLSGARVAFLPRHGRGHRLSPSEIPARANFYALKSLGVERVVSVSAVGSLKEEIEPLHLVVPDQLIDRTRGRKSTFFGDGIVAHVGIADPYCADLSAVLEDAAVQQGTTTHAGGTYVVIEGPQFSTRAESALYRSWGASVIGMTALPEAKLAREAEICYATLALVTDYDVWHESEQVVSVEAIVANLNRNAVISQRVMRSVVSVASSERTCPCASALKDAIITSPEHIDEDVRRRLAPIIERYVQPTPAVVPSRT